MKKNFFLICFLFLIFIFSACKKENSKVEEPVKTSNTEIIKKVNLWLENQKSLAITDAKKTVVETVKNNLVFDKLNFEEYKGNEKFLVIPINKGFVSKNNKDKNPGNFLLLIINTAGEIRTGSIAQYRSATVGQDNSMLASNTFSKIFNYKDILFEATFTFLSITDNFNYEIGFKNGKAHSYAITKQKEKPAGSGRGESTEQLQCYEVYLVTYYEDGSQTEEYLYTYCNGGECQENIVAGRGAFTSCDGGGGGGSNGNDPIYEFEALRDQIWVVYVLWKDPTHTIGSINAGDRIRGKRNSSYPEGGYFTSITSLNSGCGFCDSDHPYDVWWETSHTGTASNQIATSNVTGNLNYRGDQYRDITKSNTWTFQQVFP